jgi:hypothetical protein
MINTSYVKAMQKLHLPIVASKHCADEYYRRYLQDADAMTVKVDGEKMKQIVESYLTKFPDLLKERDNSNDYLLQYGSTFGVGLQTETTKFVEEGLLKWVMREDRRDTADRLRKGEDVNAQLVDRVQKMETGGQGFRGHARCNASLFS